MVPTSNGQRVKSNKSIIKRIESRPTVHSHRGDRQTAGVALRNGARPTAIGRDDDTIDRRRALGAGGPPSIVNAARAFHYPIKHPTAAGVSSLRFSHGRAVPVCKF